MEKLLAPGMKRVREYFVQAVALDPSYAPAQTGLSGYYAFGAANGILPPDECWPRAEEGLRKSLALDDTQAESYHLLAAMELYYKRDWPAAERAFRHGAELIPNFADIPHHYALMSWLCSVVTRKRLRKSTALRYSIPSFPD